VQIFHLKPHTIHGAMIQAQGARLLFHVFYEDVLLLQSASVAKAGGRAVCRVHVSLSARHRADERAFARRVAMVL
jgi:hypothetical protein